MYFRTVLIAAILVLVGEAAPSVKRNDDCEQALIHVELCTGLLAGELCPCLRKHEQEIADIEYLLSVCCAS